MGLMCSTTSNTLSFLRCTIHRLELLDSRAHFLLGLFFIDSSAELQFSSHFMRGIVISPLSWTTVFLGPSGQEPPCEFSLCGLHRQKVISRRIGHSAFRIARPHYPGGYVGCNKIEDRDLLLSRTKLTRDQTRYRCYQVDDSVSGFVFLEDPESPQDSELKKQPLLYEEGLTDR